MADRRGNERDAPGKGEIAGPVDQALAGEVESDQGRRAGGVDGNAQPLEVEKIRDAGRENGQGVADESVRRIRRGTELVDVIAVLAPHEDRAPLPVQGVSAVASVFEGLPGFLQEQALLGIGELSL